MAHMPSSNLVGIPGRGDVQAVAVLDRSPEVVDGPFLRTIDKNAAISVGRYGIRAATLALRNRDADLLARALFAVSLSAIALDEDRRDTMVTLALHHFTAQQLDLEPAPLFDQVAGRIANQSIAGLLREFGSRSDVTLDAFRLGAHRNGGWRRL
jgi:hypothetical protein